MIHYTINTLIYSLNKCITKNNYKLLIAIPDIETCFNICQQYFKEQNIDYNFSESFIKLDDNSGAKLYKILIILKKSKSIITITSLTEESHGYRYHSILIDDDYSPSVKYEIFAPMENLQYNNQVK